MSPIKREARELYPIEWPALAAEIKEGVDYICLECGKQCRRPGEPYDTQRRTLTIAHYDHEYDAASVFVAALCCPCHLKHDAVDAWRIRRRRERLRQQSSGQRALFEVTP